MKFKIKILIILLCIPVVIYSENDNDDKISKENFSENIPINIMSQGNLSEKELLSFFSAKNPEGDLELIKTIIPIYVLESQKEGVNHDIAFAQMLLETGYLNYGGIVLKNQKNFCGLGATNATNRGWSFENDTLGVIAHIQHLKAYGSTDSLNYQLIDPRYDLVSPKGKSPTIYGLTGTWAVDKQYATKIYKILTEMYLHQVNNECTFDDNENALGSK